MERKETSKKKQHLGNFSKSTKNITSALFDLTLSDING